MADFDHHYANLPGVRIHYVTMGQGRPVVLIHGWPQTWYEWRRVMPLLASDFMLVAPDLRGLGDSSRPSKGYEKKTVANDVWLLMREHRGTSALPSSAMTGARRWRSASRRTIPTP
jgi:pimeloyl-ACP methyl ester carboxylesterase